MLVKIWCYFKQQQIRLPNLYQRLFWAGIGIILLGNGCLSVLNREHKVQVDLASKGQMLLTLTIYGFG